MLIKNFSFFLFKDYSVVLPAVISINCGSLELVVEMNMVSLWLWSTEFRMSKWKGFYLSFPCVHTTDRCIIHFLFRCYLPLYLIIIIIIMLSVPALFLFSRRWNSFCHVSFWNINFAVQKKATVDYITRHLNMYIV